MANKYYRQNLRNGTNPTKRKSNIAKIMEAFGPKKKIKKEKPKKRMFANKGGGADSGRMGEIKSKLAVAMDKLKSMEPNNPRFSQRDIDRVLKMMESKRKKEKTPLDKEKNKTKPPFSRFVFNSDNKGFAKGGRAALKKGSKFPDHSGDGKITQKDILMAKGVIPKTKSKKKII